MIDCPSGGEWILFCRKIATLQAAFSSSCIGLQPSAATVGPAFLFVFWRNKFWRKIILAEKKNAGRNFPPSSWQFAVGSWQLAVGRWQVAVGSWQVACVPTVRGLWERLVLGVRVNIGKVKVVEQASTDVVELRKVSRKVSQACEAKQT